MEEVCDDKANRRSERSGVTMRSCCLAGTASIGIAATLVAGAAAAQNIHPTVRVTLAGRIAFPRPTGATLGPGVTRPGGAILGPGVTRPTGATAGPGVR